MKIKLLTAWLLLLCLVLTACHKKPTSEPTETDAPLQTAQVVGIRPADSLDWEEGFEFSTESEVTQPLDVTTIDSLPDFFLDETNRNGKLLPAPAETDENGYEIYGSMTDPACVPNTDRSPLYGTTYRFRLTVEREKDAFCFQYDTVEQKLAVVLPNVNIPLLLIFRLDGVQGDEFIRMAQNGDYVSATLVCARNIPGYETMYLLNAFSSLDDTDVESIPSARYLVAMAAVGSTSVYGSYADNSIEWMRKIISVYGKNPT